MFMQFSMRIIWVLLKPAIHYGLEGLGIESRVGEIFLIRPDRSRVPPTLL